MSAFQAPPGAAVSQLLGRGSCFQVALVDVGGVRHLAKRPVLESTDAVPPIERERRALAALRHPDIPRLVAAGDDSAGAFVIEALVPGVPLDRASATGDLAARAALALAATCLTVHVHEAGLVHGDLGPQAFLADERGRVSLIDFSAAGFGPDLPAIGRGTLPFVAPELCRGDTPPTQATDRYSLALLVSVVLCGARLWPALPEPALLVAVGERGHDLSVLHGAHQVPAALRAELARLLTFEPALRPDALTSLRVALEAARHGGSGGVSSGP